MTNIDDCQQGSRLVPQQRRSREARARILAAAEALLREEGLDGFSMAAVAKLAGMPVGNIYRRFEGKEDILQALKDIVAVRIGNAVTAAVQEAAHMPLAAYVDAFADAVVRVFSGDEDLHRALFDPRVASRRMLETGQTVRTRIYGLFLDGIRPRLAGVPETRLEAAVKVAFSIITNAALTKVRGQDPIMSGFGWEDVRTQYAAAAIAYLESACGTSRSDL